MFCVVFIKGSLCERLQTLRKVFFVVVKLEGLSLVGRTLYRALRDLLKCFEGCLRLVTKFKVFLATQMCALYLGGCSILRALFGLSARRIPFKLQIDF